MAHKARPLLGIPNISLLLNPKFRIDGWYAKHLGRLWGYSSTGVQNLRRVLHINIPPMGDPLAEKAVQVLQAGLPYDLDPPNEGLIRTDQFDCARLPDGSYEVQDCILAFKVQVPLHLMRNPRALRWLDGECA